MAFDEQASKLRSEGLSYREIAKRLNTNAMRVGRTLNPEQYRVTDRRSDRRDRKRATDTSKTTLCSGCGELCWRTHSNVKDYTHLCHDCRRRAQWRDCAHCEQPFQARDRTQRYCSHRCGCLARTARKIDKAVHWQRRRAWLKGAECERVVRRVVFDRDKWRCGLCGRKVKKHLKHPNPWSVSLDHLLPLSKGGAHSYANVQCAHLQCNIDKKNGGGGEQLALL